MTVIARKIISVPERTATETWEVISRLLAPNSSSEAARELASVVGIASSLITREAMSSPMVLYGSGPRVRLYCLYNEDAVEGDGASESNLPFDATSGDWKLSLPCPEDDLAWVQTALSAKSKRISARDMDTLVEEEDANADEDAAASISTVDLEAFFKS
jgi:hypothetical protein